MLSLRETPLQHSASKQLYVFPSSICISYPASRSKPFRGDEWRRPDNKVPTPHLSEALVHARRHEVRPDVWTSNCPVGRHEVTIFSRE